ncbi:hypothetical protein PLEI_1452 [Photobacterium leiognathi lrivu.4.1]|uniref:Uncharacterized protein n=2 Tax=Photobacterium leiognathi TaxID=553611 RepID=A0A0U1P5H0_PHOLE|nr:hypothetical protein PLEI_1452 [Photobacterium leiognathi lrivu.4.1]
MYQISITEFIDGKQYAKHVFKFSKGKQTSPNSISQYGNVTIYTHDHYQVAELLRSCGSIRDEWLIRKCPEFGVITSIKHSTSRLVVRQSEENGRSSLTWFSNNDRKEKMNCPEWATTTVNDYVLTEFYKIIGRTDEY